jgi:hypothetical protein
MTSVIEEFGMGCMSAYGERITRVSSHLNEDTNDRVNALANVKGKRRIAKIIKTLAQLNDGSEMVAGF